MSGDEKGSTILPEGSTIPFPDDEEQVSSIAPDRMVFSEGWVDGDVEELDVDRPARYSKRRMLGRGGNGVVIAAVDRKMQRRVALKISHAKRFDRSTTVRFLREARVTGQLNHPNVMPVYDIGPIKKATCFLR